MFPVRPGKDSDDDGMRLSVCKVHCCFSPFCLPSSVLPQCLRVLVRKHGRSNRGPGLVDESVDMGRHWVADVGPATLIDNLIMASSDFPFLTPILMAALSEQGSVLEQVMPPANPYRSLKHYTYAC